MKLNMAFRGFVPLMWEQRSPKFTIYESVKRMGDSDSSKDSIHLIYVN